MQVLVETSAQFFTLNGDEYWTICNPTPVMVNYPSFRISSKWFFYAEKSLRVYLHTGWNTFGRNPLNTFEIRSPIVKLCEFYIYVPFDEELSPVGFCADQNVVVNGIRINGENIPWTFEKLTKAAVIREDKAVCFYFFHESIVDQ